MFVHADQFLEVFVMHITQKLSNMAKMLLRPQGSTLCIVWKVAPGLARSAIWLGDWLTQTTLMELLDSTRVKVSGSQTNLLCD